MTSEAERFEERLLAMLNQAPGQDNSRLRELLAHLYHEENVLFQCVKGMIFKDFHPEFPESGSGEPELPTDPMVLQRFRALLVVGAAIGWSELPHAIRLWCSQLVLAPLPETGDPFIRQQASQVKYLAGDLVAQSVVVNLTPLLIRGEQELRPSRSPEENSSEDSWSMTLAA